MAVQLKDVCKLRTCSTWFLQWEYKASVVSLHKKCINYLYQVFWHHQSTCTSQLVCLASSGWLLSCVWKDLKLLQVCAGPDPAIPGLCTGLFPECCSHCLCLLQPCVSILAEPTEKLTAQLPMEWGNTCHTHFGKQRQGNCTCKSWMVGGRECSPATCVQYAAFKHMSPWQRLEVYEKEEKNRQGVLSSKLQVGQNCLFFFFFSNVVLPLCCP